MQQSKVGKTTNYKIDDLEFHKIYKKEGTFVTETGVELKYKTGWIEFKSKEYPMIMRAKIDKVFMEYFDNMELAPLADSESGSEFWSDN